MADLATLALYGLGWRIPPSALLAAMLAGAALAGVVVWRFVL